MRPQRIHVRGAGQQIGHRGRLGIEPLLHRLQARNISVFCREAGPPAGAPLADDLDVRIGDHLAHHRQELLVVLVRQRRMSRLASASEGITLVRKPPLMIVGTIDVRIIEL